MEKEIPRGRRSSTEVKPARPLPPEVWADEEEMRAKDFWKQKNGGYLPHLIFPIPDVYYSQRHRSLRMKSRHLFFFILTCILFSSPLAGGGAECASPSAAVSAKKEAEREDSVMRTTRLESGVVIVENLKYPHENLDLIMGNHFLSCNFEPDNSLMISVGRNTGHENFSFSVYKNNDRSFCKYWFTLEFFSVLDYDGDGLADVRQKGSLPEYEIRLNDEWISCRKIWLKGTSIYSRIK